MFFRKDAEKAKSFLSVHMNVAVRRTASVKIQ